MIDVHVLTHSGTKQHWLDRCLASLASEAVAVHVVAGVEGNVGAGRAAGYALGDHEFVAYVDSDDYVVPGWYRAGLLLMQQHHAVVPREYVEYQDGRRHSHTKSRHNGAIYRRSDIEPLIPAMPLAPVAVDYLTRKSIKPVSVENVGYVWTVHTGGMHNAMTAQLVEEEEAQWLTMAR